MKAIVFTHIPERNPDDLDLNEFIHVWSGRFEAYARCRNVSVVFVYVSYGLEQLLRRKRGGRAEIALDVLAGEARLFNALHVALNEAQQRAGDNGGPEFVFIGLAQLAELLKRLGELSPALVAELAGGTRNFTYDAPKFVEAVIRLRLQNDQNRDGPAVLRFDADVGVNEAGIDAILRRVQAEREQIQRRDFFFMSGGYSGQHEQDYNNIFPVRLNWFVDADTGAPRDGCLQFLRDLGDLGATQVPSASCPRSSVIPAAVAVRERPYAQPISGAGLVMSVRAITLLPPFMNFTCRTIWVDDHLKRCLHEQLGHLSPTRIERVATASFQQHRGPRPRDYLDRLARGCLLHAAIHDKRGPGPLSVAVRAIVQSQAGGRRRVDRRKLLASLDAGLDAVLPKVASVLATVWTQAAYGSSTFVREARRLKWARLVAEVKADAKRYVALVEKWPLFLQAIQRIDNIDVAWLAYNDRTDAPNASRSRAVAFGARPAARAPLGRARASGKKPDKIFIGHGHSREWTKLRDLLRDTLNLDWDEFERESPVGYTVTGRLGQMLDQATFAFLVLTAEDEQADGAMRARANVVHEAGLCQGRLGFARAILLLEEGCESFSNVAGLVEIRFPKGDLLAKSEEIRRVLLREHIVGEQGRASAGGRRRQVRKPQPRPGSGPASAP